MKLAEDRRKRIIRACLAVTGVIAAGLIFNKILEEWAGFKAVVDNIYGAFAPIIVGAVIAFLMNPVLVFFDRLFHTIFQDRLIKNERRLFKVSRTLSIIFTTVIFLAVIAGFIWLVVPQIYDSIKLLVSNMDMYFQNLTDIADRINEWLKKLDIPEKDLTKYLNTAYDKVEDIVNTQIMPNVDKIVKDVGSGIFTGFKFVYNFFIGIIVSIYIMANKEYLASRGKKIVYAVFSVKRANQVLDGLGEMNIVFSQFIGGKIVDSMIIGMITFAVLSIIDMPYAVLISVIVGVTNVIPFFGPIIGAIPGILLVFIVDPFMSLVLAIVILVIQQLDGNVIGPAILGDTIGLSSIWILVAVTVGGGLFGFAGMLLGVPTFACCYMYINRSCTAKLKEKNLVYETAEFERIRRIDEETGEPLYVTPEERDIRFKKKTPEQKAAEREARRRAKQRNHAMQYEADELATEAETDKTERETTDDASVK